MRNRMVAVLLTLALLVGFAIPAYASELPKNEQYDATLNQLEEFMKGNRQTKPADIRKSFDQLGLYEKSVALSFYALALERIEDKNYNGAAQLTKNLQANNDFIKFLEETQVYGTVAALEQYAVAHKAESDGETDKAIVLYGECAGFWDSTERWNQLRDTKLEGKYQEAMGHFNKRTNNGYEQAYVLFADLGNYKESAAYAEKANTLRATSGSVSTAPDDMTDAEMFAFFKSQGLNDFGAAGLMGNLYAESFLIANDLTKSGNSKSGLTDVEYTEQVDDLVYTNFIYDGYGYGLAHWTYYTRKMSLLTFMTEKGLSIGDKRGQCDFIMKELEADGDLLNILKTATSVKKASDAVLTIYMRPTDQSDTVKINRAISGHNYYDRYAK